MRPDKLYQPFGVSADLKELAKCLGLIAQCNSTVYSVSAPGAVAAKPMVLGTGLATATHIIPMMNPNEYGSSPGNYVKISVSDTGPELIRKSRRSLRAVLYHQLVKSDLIEKT